MEDNLKALGVFALKLAELDYGKGLNRDQFPVLNTEYTDPETWWNTLIFDHKLDVGCVAMHFNKITANYRWDNYTTKYCDLRKSQKKIIAFVLAQKDKNYSMFPLLSFIKI
jgi:hypothetical protein